MSLPLLMLIAVAEPNALPECGPVSISRALALARTSELVCLAHDPDGVRGEYRLRRTSTDAHGGKTVTWVRTRNCPAAISHIQAMEAVAMPRPDLPGFGDEQQTIMFDGASYRLAAYALYGGDGGKLIVESNVGTPLARWIDGTPVALRPCWRESI